jgi:hypothetical protein
MEKNMLNLVFMFLLACSGSQDDSAATSDSASVAE